MARLSSRVSNTFYLWLFLFPLLGILTTSASSTAQDNNRFESDLIVVTATKLAEPVRDIPRNVTIITAQDIQQASSKNIVDLLAREAGLTLRSPFGSDKQAVVDIRGMGDTAVSNVIVMVDGIKINSPDLTGPDFSSIPLDQVERIEIVRGAGSVIYGNGAVGGVINVITKKAGKKTKARLREVYGSYQTMETRASYSGTRGPSEYYLNAGYYGSDGYRDNGRSGKKDAGLKFGHDLTSRLDLSFSGSVYEDDYGLPGTVSLADQGQRALRIRTASPDDSGKTTGGKAVAKAEFEGGRWGELTAQAGYRFRDNSYVLGFTPLLSRSDQTDRINEETRFFMVNLAREYDLFEQAHMLLLGLDYYKTDYLRTEFSRDQRKNSEIRDLGVFIFNQWSLTERLSLNWGIRLNEFTGRFRSDNHQKFGGVKRWVNGQEERKTWSNQAYDLGFLFSLPTGLALFTSYAASFRVPNVDELAQAEPGLSPQKGRHLEIGGRAEMWANTEITLTFFQIRISDEIFFGEGLTGGIALNRNYDQKTIRNGLEADVKFFPVDSLYIWANGSYTDARFSLRNTFMPLVPKYKFSLGLEWRFLKPASISFAGMWVGSRYDGNDETNDRFAKLKPYKVLDGKITYQYKNFYVLAGIKNIFDELYSTSAYSERYYPMPGREFYGGVEWRY